MSNYDRDRYRIQLSDEQCDEVLDALEKAWDELPERSAIPAWNAVIDCKEHWEHDHVVLNAAQCRVVHKAMKIALGEAAAERTTTWFAVRDASPILHGTRNPPTERPTIYSSGFETNRRRH